jgi:hypothetical protein
VMTRREESRLLSGVWWCLYCGPLTALTPLHCYLLVQYYCPLHFSPSAPMVSTSHLPPTPARSRVSPYQRCPAPARHALAARSTAAGLTDLQSHP